MLNRSNTWPVVVVRLDNDGRPATKLDANFNEKTNRNVDDQAAINSIDPATHIDPRKAATLNRHYYPEGGWGWCVIGASVLVQILNHGLQLSSGVLLEPAASKFRARITDSGKQFTA